MDNIAAVELPEVMPDRKPGLEVAEFDAALVVFDVDVNQVHLLQQMHAAVFDSCDGSTVRASVVAEFVDAGIGDEAESEQMVASVIDDLGSLGLLAGTTAFRPPPCRAEAVTIGGTARSQRRWLSRR